MSNWFYSFSGLTLTDKAITLSIAFVTGISYLLSLMFSVQDYSSLADTHTGLPLAEIFNQATSTRGGAFGLVFIVWIALGPCVIGSQLSMNISLARLCQVYLTII